MYDNNIAGGTAVAGAGYAGSTTLPATGGLSFISWGLWGVATFVMIITLIFLFLKFRDLIPKKER